MHIVMVWLNHIRDHRDFTHEENIAYWKQQELNRKEEEIIQKQKYDNFAKPFLELENDPVPIKYGVDVYKKANRNIFFPLPSDKWISNYIKEREIFRPEKIKNKWVCNKNAIDIYNFERIKP